MQAHPVAYAAQVILGLIALAGVAMMAWWTCVYGPLRRLSRRGGIGMRSLTRVMIDIDPRASFRSSGGVPIDGVVQLSWEGPDGSITSVYVTGTQAREVATKLNRITEKPTAARKLSQSAR